MHGNATVWNGRDFKNMLPRLTILLFNSDQEEPHSCAVVRTYASSFMLLVKQPSSVYNTVY